VSTLETESKSYQQHKYGSVIEPLC